MKKVIIIHAWDSDPKEHWYQEEKEILEKIGYEVDIPKMPGGRWPKEPEWLEVIKKLKPNESTIMIGHSLGPAAIFRYLEQADQKVKKVIGIAAFAKDLGLPETANFFEKPFDWDKIKQNADEFIIINQKNDPYVPPKEGELASQKLNVDLVLVEGNNHFDKMDLNLINKHLK